MRMWGCRLHSFLIWRSGCKQVHLSRFTAQLDGGIGSNIAFLTGQNDASQRLSNGQRTVRGHEHDLMALAMDTRRHGGVIWSHGRHESWTCPYWPPGGLSILSEHSNMVLLGPFLRPHPSEQASAGTSINDDHELQ